jgi:hypothetical protein
LLSDLSLFFLILSTVRAHRTIFNPTYSFSHKLDVS